MGGKAVRSKVKDLKRILNALALDYTFNGSYGEAIRYHLESLKIREAEGNQPEISITLNNIGLTYFKLKNYKKALFFYNRALDLKRKIGDTYDLDFLLLNIGLCYSEVGDYVKGRKYIEQGIAVCKSDCNNQVGIEAQYGLGVINYESKRIIEAKKNFVGSFNLAMKNGNKRFQAENLLYIAKIAISERHWKEAKISLGECEKSALGYGQILSETYKLSAFFYKQMNDCAKTSYYQGKYIHLNDTLMDEGLINSFAGAQVEFEERENLVTIAPQKQILALNAQLITRQKQQTIFIAVIALLLLLLAGVFYKNYRGKLTANRRLDEKVKERTEELRHSHQSLDKSFDLQQLTMQQVWHEGQSILSSVKGLCHAALLDVQEAKGKEYIGKVDDSTGQLATLLARLKSWPQVWGSGGSTKKQGLGLRNLAG